MARTDHELFKALLDLRADPLEPDIPDDVLDAMVRAAGGDPEALAKGTLVVVEAETERRRLAWQDAARKKRESLEQLVQARRRSRHGLTTDELLAEIEARKNNPNLAQPIALAARKRKPGQQPNAEELRMLLEDLDELEAMAAGDSDDNDRGE
jgi:hypothetical protein